jgi:hypothetical protein
VNTISSVAVACATLASGLLLATADARAAKPGIGVDHCAGKQPSFVFNKTLPASIGSHFFLADGTGLCQWLLFSVNAGDYDRFASFRVVGSEGRIVTTDGLLKSDVSSLRRHVAAQKPLHGPCNYKGTWCSLVGIVLKTVYSHSRLQPFRAVERRKKTDLGVIR